MKFAIDKDVPIPTGDHWAAYDYPCELRAVGDTDPLGGTIIDVRREEDGIYYLVRPDDDDAVATYNARIASERPTATILYGPWCRQ